MTMIMSTNNNKPKEAFCENCRYFYLTKTKRERCSCYENQGQTTRRKFWCPDHDPIKDKSASN